MASSRPGNSVPMAERPGGDAQTASVNSLWSSAPNQPRTIRPQDRTCRPSAWEKTVGSKAVAYYLEEAKSTFTAPTLEALTSVLRGFQA